MSRTDAGLLALKGHAAGGAAVAGDELVRCGREAFREEVEQ